MYKTENELLAAACLDDYDLLAQRALRLRKALSDLVPFAAHDPVAIDGICRGAQNANAMLLLCHEQRDYDFVRQQLAAQATATGKVSSIHFFPQLGASRLPLSELQRVIGEFELWPQQIRAAHHLPTVLINGERPGFDILYGEDAARYSAQMEPANSP